MTSIHSVASLFKLKPEPLFKIARSGPDALIIDSVPFRVDG